MSIIVGFVVAFAVTFLVGKVLIPWLVALKAGQTIKEIGPKWHMNKQGTPTMGGIMFVVGILAAVLTAGMPDILAGHMGGLFVFLFALVFGLIGLIDDYVKVKYKKNEGLTPIQKIVLQLAATILFLVLLRWFGYVDGSLYIPFVNITIRLPWVVYMIFSILVVVGTVNAVNLTDGVDGLATGVTMPVALFYVAAAAFWGYTELGIFAGGLFGGLCAFLIYNFHPAKVFMGDTGSLFLGGAVAGLAFSLDMPLVLALVGIIYIAEALSVMMQVGYFKLTHGKRIFRMAPLHHHFEMGGWSEEKLFTVFTVITVVTCILSFWGIMDRFPVV